MTIEYELRITGLLSNPEQNNAHMVFMLYLHIKMLNCRPVVRIDKTNCALQMTIECNIITILSRIVQILSTVFFRHTYQHVNF